MKYCPVCLLPYTDDISKCDKCESELKEAQANDSVCVAVIKGTDRSTLEPALRDVGIPCRFVNPGEDIYNNYNIKVRAESEYMTLVPLEFYTKAFDTCVSLGLVDPNQCRIEQEAPSEDTPSYDERFEKANGVKRRTWQIVWTVIIILAACLMIWGIDFAAEYIKHLANGV